ncbi:uncharacterized protein LOC105420000 isoform X2 [Amborella trichopoda]|uniref:uncharacterized protein LOC105420000 isoform X2 n=1 Tax=Amborella trichopoda TaxID=13333 RepID=UPI0009BE7D14|nr:uncharacterized protein LOC105420000 isoform X2 [Amborella trichopoda]|eukprot:XP_020529536.1 uncharacterized protein LOC105420000 isoform X2 [Amborella trichopoda]
MPGTVQVSVLELADLPPSLLGSEGNHICIRVAIGKQQCETMLHTFMEVWKLGEAWVSVFPVLNLRDSLVIKFIDREKEITQTERGNWEDLFELMGGGRIHLKLQFILSDEEIQRVKAMREAALRKREDEISKMGVTIEFRRSTNTCNLAVLEPLGGAEDSRGQTPDQGLENPQQGVNQGKPLIKLVKKSPDGNGGFPPSTPVYDPTDTDAFKKVDLAEKGHISTVPPSTPVYDPTDTDAFKKVDLAEKGYTSTVKEKIKAFEGGRDSQVHKTQANPSMKFQLSNIDSESGTLQVPSIKEEEATSLLMEMVGKPRRKAVRKDGVGENKKDKVSKDDLNLRQCLPINDSMVPRKGGEHNAAEGPRATGSCSSIEGGTGKDTRRWTFRRDDVGEMRKAEKNPLLLEERKVLEEETDSRKNFLLDELTMGEEGQETNATEDPIALSSRCSKEETILPNKQEQMNLAANDLHEELISEGHGKSYNTLSTVGDWNRRYNAKQLEDFSAKSVKLMESREEIHHPKLVEAATSCSSLEHVSTALTHGGAGSKGGPPLDNFIGELTVSEDLSFLKETDTNQEQSHMNYNMSVLDEKPSQNTGQVHLDSEFPSNSKTQVSQPKLDSLIVSEKTQDERSSRECENSRVVPFNYNLDLVTSVEASDEIGKLLALTEVEDEIFGSLGDWIITDKLGPKCFTTGSKKLRNLAVVCDETLEVQSAETTCTGKVIGQGSPDPRDIMEKRDSWSVMPLLDVGLRIAAAVACGIILLNSGRR